MDKVGVIRKQRRISQQIQIPGTSFVYDPMGRDDRSGPAEGSKGARSPAEMVQVVQQTPKIEEALASRGEFPDESAYEGTMDERDVKRVEAQHRRETQRLKEQQEAAKPKTQFERYGMEAARRHLDRHPQGGMGTAMVAGEKARRAGKGGVKGRELGAGIAGFLGAMRGLTSLAESGAAGQEFFGSLGQAGLSGQATYDAASTPLAEGFGAAGARAGAASVRGKPVAVAQPTTKNHLTGMSIPSQEMQTDSRASMRPAKQHPTEFSPPSNFRLGEVSTGRPGRRPNIFTPGGTLQQRATQITNLNDAGLNLGEDGQTTFRGVGVRPHVAEPTGPSSSPVSPDEQARAEGAFDTTGEEDTQPPGGPAEGQVTPEEMEEAQRAYAPGGKVTVQSSAGQSMSNVKPPEEEDEQ